MLCKITRHPLLSTILLIIAHVFAPASMAGRGELGPKLGLQTWTLRTMTFEQVVEFAAANHIKYLQLTSNHLDPNAARAETVRKLALLKKHDLVPYTFGVNSTSTDKESNRKLFEFARLIGA